MEIDSGGNVIEVKVGGVVTGNTGHINEDWDENLFHVLYTTSGLLQGGIMIVDNGYRYATYADQDLYIGVLEKGAPSLPVYAASDIVWSYSGGAYVFMADSGTWNWDGEAISMTVESSLVFTGNAPGEVFSGGFNSSLRSPTYGGYAGTMDVPSMGTLDIMALVCPNKNFVAAYAKEMGTTPMSLDYYMLIGLIK